MFNKERKEGTSYEKTYVSTDNGSSHGCYNCMLWRGKNNRDNGSTCSINSSTETRRHSSTCSKTGS